MLPAVSSCLLRPDIYQRVDLSYRDGEQSYASPIMLSYRRDGFIIASSIYNDFSLGYCSYMAKSCRRTLHPFINPSQKSEPIHFKNGARLGESQYGPNILRSLPFCYSDNEVKVIQGIKRISSEISMSELYEVRRVNTHGYMGKSLVVTIPREMAEIAKVTKGSYVRFEIMDDGRIMMNKLGTG